MGWSRGRGVIGVPVVSEQEKWFGVVGDEKGMGATPSNNRELSITTEPSN